MSPILDERIALQLSVLAYIIGQPVAAGRATRTDRRLAADQASEPREDWRASGKTLYYWLLLANSSFDWATLRSYGAADPVVSLFSGTESPIICCENFGSKRDVSERSRDMH